MLTKAQNGTIDSITARTVLRIWFFGSTTSPFGHGAATGAIGSTIFGEFRRIRTLIPSDSFNAQTNPLKSMSKCFRRAPRSVRTVSLATFCLSSPRLRERLLSQSAKHEMVSGPRHSSPVGLAWILWLRASASTMRGNSKIEYRTTWLLSTSVISRPACKSRRLRTPGSEWKLPGRHLRVSRPVIATFPIALSVSR